MTDSTHGLMAFAGIGVGLSDVQLLLPNLLFFLLAGGQRGVFDDALPVGRQLAQRGQLGGGREVAKLAAFQRGAGERLRHEAQLLSVWLRFGKERGQLAWALLHEPERAVKRVHKRRGLAVLRW